MKNGNGLLTRCTGDTNGESSREEALVMSHWFIQLGEEMSLNDCSLEENATLCCYCFC